MPKGIQYEVNAFPAGQLCGGNKVRITCHQDNLINLALVAEGGNVQPNSHVDAFLHRSILEIVVRQRREFDTASEELLKLAVFQSPFPVVHQVPQSKSDFSEFAQLIVQRQAKSRLGRFGEINGTPSYRIMRPFLQRRTVVKEYSIQIVTDGGISLVQMRQRQLKGGPCHRLGIGRVLLRVTCPKPA